MTHHPDIFNRTIRLLGDDRFRQLVEKRVIILGIGGVGSWTAEALVRSGVKNLTIVDADVVAESNINRQLMATVDSIGRPKTEVLAERLRTINPEANITTINRRYTAEDSALFQLDSYDCIIDAIDSLADKQALIIEATSIKHARFYSSMGAALKLDPTRIAVAEFWKVKGCPLAAALRQRFRRSGVMPRKKFKCVYSEERLENHDTADDNSGAMTYGKAAINGAICHITAIFGMTLAGLVIEDAVK